jgi:putative permease
VWALAPFIVSQLSTLKGSLPQYVDGTVKLFDEATKFIESSTGGIFQVDLSDRVRDWLTRQSSTLIETIPRALSASASVLFLSPILGFFILKDGRQFSLQILRLVPNNIFELALNLQYQISEQIAHYIRARILESIIVGLVCLIGFWMIGMPYAFLLAAFAAVSNLIPYVGPIFGAAPGLILALINHSTGLMIAIVLAIYALAQIIDMFIVIPLVVARIVNLHPVTVIVVVILGAQLLGVLGMLISIPVASAIKVTSTSIYNHLTDYSG